ncbi:MAG: AAA family ATPase [Candidatus Accumulibacter sp.]|jgi:SpoVK/Ycf46/Vps4 family AAA+-type ATPase|nr:AAA family ATPase [Accumulibacter sp.]
MRKKSVYRLPKFLVRQNNAKPASEIEPIARLWMLRILMKLDGHKNFIHERCIGDDELAQAIGLIDVNQESCDSSEEDEYDAKEMLTRLKALHRKAEKQLSDATPPDDLRQNIEHLAALAGLSEVDCRILEFAVMHKTEAMLYELTSQVKTPSFVKLCHAVSIILDIPEKEVRVALGTQGILTCSGLISIGRSGVCSDLSDRLELLSNTFADRIASPEADIVSLLRGMVSTAAPAELGLEDFAHIQKTLDVLVPYLRQAVATGKTGVNIFIHGKPGTGKTQLARVLAATLERELFEVASEDEDGDEIGGRKRLRALRAAQSFFGKRQALVVFDEAEEIFGREHEFLGFIFPNKDDKSHGKAALNRVLEENPVPTLWISNFVRGVDPAYIRRFDLVFELPIAPKSQRQRMIEEACSGLAEASSIARLAECESLAPAVVSRAAAVVRAIGDQLDSQAKTKAIEHLIGNTLEAQGHAGLRRNDSTRLPEIYDPAFIHADVDLAELAEGLKSSRSARLCLYGPPGTGKTAYGRWLAEQLDMPLLVKRGSDLLSMWVGECEKNIAKAFRQAEREGALLLIDEVDSFLQDRRDAQRSWEVTQVNEILTQMEAFPGVFIASTNLMSGLDQASLRRFDLKTKFDFLRPEQSVGLLRRHCEQLTLDVPDKEVEIALQRLRNLTPGDFAAVLRQNRFRPIKTAWQLVDMLQAECGLKEGKSVSIGFH